MGTSRSKAIAKPLEERTTHELMELAAKGDAKACKLYFTRLEAEGGLDRVIELLAGSAQINAHSHESLLVEEAFRRKMKQMRQELGADTGTALERLLIERVVLCWFHLHNTEVNYAAKSKGSLRLELAVHLEKSLDRAEQRYQNAVKSLAIVRRLQIPAVQVNIGEKQINIVQAGTEQTNAVLTGGSAEGASATPIL